MTPNVVYNSNSFPPPSRPAAALKPAPCRGCGWLLLCFPSATFSQPPRPLGGLLLLQSWHGRERKERPGEGKSSPCRHGHSGTSVSTLRKLLQLSSSWGHAHGFFRNGTTSPPPQPIIGIIYLVFLSRDSASPPHFRASPTTYHSLPFHRPLLTDFLFPFPRPLRTWPLDTVLSQVVRVIPGGRRRSFPQSN